MTMDSRTRWLALLIVCLGDLMIVLDVTIVGVALPSIREDLGFSETSLAWVVNAYLLTFGGFLLLGGRLGDLFGHRRLFVAGIALFTAASLACGLATSQAMLVGARAVQGLGGAVVSAVALSLIVTLFTEPSERAKAMGVFGFVASAGGSIGVLLGGILTDTCYEIAKPWKLKRIVAETSQSNERMLAVFRDRGFLLRPDPGGDVVEVEKGLPAPADLS